jgi:hypothetical protein
MRIHGKAIFTLTPSRPLIERFWMFPASRLL